MSKSKKNPILLIVIIIVIIAIGVGVYFLVKSKEKYTDSNKYEICPGNDGDNRNNNSNITSAEECERAKGDKTWKGSEDEPRYPKGCYVYNDNDVYYYSLY